MPLDDSAARERALDTRSSFIVQAPAGSGKTELLMQRYLALLAVVEEPEAIVAITFTKKAAAEMRGRVLAALERADEEPEADHQRATRDLARAALARDRLKRWGLTENPSRIPIDTFDALCLRIAAQMPWMARLGSLPSPTEKPADLYADAARATINMVEAAEPVARAARTLLLYFDNDAATLAAQLAAMLEKREQWLHIVVPARGNMDAVRQSLEESLDELVSEKLARLSRVITDDIAADVVRFGCRGTRCLPSDVSGWSEVAGILLTGSGEWRKTINRAQGYLPADRDKTACLSFLQSLQGQYDALRQALHAVRSLPEPHFDEAQWRTLCAVFEVLYVAAGELNATFAERGKVDFTALLISALDALGPDNHPADLALSLGSRIEHILVDEFQDTSRTQLQLLRKLTSGWDGTAGRTLFLVGDPMQSIYRFRQTEVGIFLETRSSGLGALRLEPLTLTRNFRSQPAIVDWVNTVFQRVLAEPEDALTGSVQYVPFTPASALSGPAPSVHPFFDKAQAEEAERVVSLIPREGITAILVRARSHLSEIVAALRRANIPFQAVEIYQLGQRPVVQDLMSLTFALLHPADRVAWLAVLRAPWCGLRLADLHAIASPDKFRTIWSLLDDAALSAEGSARMARIRPAIERALNERGRRRLRELVESTWVLLDGPALVTSENDLADAAAFLDLLDELDEGGDLGRFGNLRKRVEELFAQPDALADGRVQVMTIHQAKGLQFDTVIVPGIGLPPRPDDKPLLAFHEFGAHGLLVAPKPEANEDKLYRLIGDQESLKAANETKRLLYVAVTRAKSALHLLGCVSLKSDGSGMAAPSSGSFLSLLWDDVEAVYTSEFERRAARHAITAVDARTPRRIRRIDLSWHAAAPPAPVLWESDEEPAVEEDPVTFEWVGDTLRHVGTVLHSSLQRIAETGIENWTEARIRSLDPAVRAALGGLGVPPSELDEAVGKVMLGLHNSLSSDRLRWVLSGHADAENECELTGWIDGRFRRVRIDRTFVDENGTRWLIDYKTSAHEGGGRKAFLENEQRRYREQLDRYARMMWHLDGRPVRVALCFPLLSEWLEWEPATAMVQGAVR